LNVDVACSAPHQHDRTPRVRNVAIAGVEGNLLPVLREVLAGGEARIDRPVPASAVVERGQAHVLQPEVRVENEEETLAGEPITAKLNRAPGNGAAIDGLKIATASGWFAARPSGTENIYKIYAESFMSAAHLDRLVSEAQGLVDTALGDRG